jgi:S-formylglutathione hydrolase FrmB
MARKTLVTLLAGMLITIVFPLSAGAASRIVTLRMHAPSLGDPHRAVRVYLPPSYDAPASRNRRYPVIILLHGWPGGEGNWAGEGRAGRTLDSLEAAGAIPELIAVMPSGSGVGLLGRSLYVDSYDGRSCMEQYIVRDLVAWVDSTFRTRADRRARGLIGLSEGGGAAINLAFKHPEVFGACGSHSGEFLLGHGLGESRIFGPEPGGSALRAANSPLLYVDHVAPRIRGQAIYFDCGLEDGELGQNRELDRRLTALGVAHTYQEFPGGHSWGYWSRHLHESLRAVTAEMR